MNPNVYNLTLLAGLGLIGSGAFLEWGLGRALFIVGFVMLGLNTLTAVLWRIRG
jgi:hypothetical protein